MIKLPSNFELNRYGLHVRLVREEDAEFIVKLRTNPKLGRYIHATENDVEKQREWIREYKKREEEGRDYYFIYCNCDRQIGVNRIYNITEDYATTGSWVCDENVNPVESISTMLIVREILFERLLIHINYFDVNKQNARVYKLHQMMGTIFIREDGENYYLSQTAENFDQNRKRIVKLYGLNTND